MHKSVVLLPFCLLLCAIAHAQSSDSLLISELIRDIGQMQVKENGAHFYTGMFPSFRECGGFPHNYQPDNNMFYTAVSAFALKKMLPDLLEKERYPVERIIERASPVFARYRNRQNHPFYSFWATDDVIMPHTFIFQYLKSVFGQGDDADDSVMALMAMENNEADNAALKTRLLVNSNLSRKKVKATYKRYRNIPAYSTWLGERMPVDFDFAVHCNLLYFILDKQLPLQRQDTATIELLAQMIARREYMTSPVYISPYYVHSSVLLYHIARLMGRFSISKLEPFKQQLIADIGIELSVCNNIMDQLILRTSLLRLGAVAPPLPTFSIEEFEKSNQESFVFFQARAAFSYPTPFKQIFLHWSYIYYYFYCPAYYKVLWLEYLVEKRKHAN